MELAVKKNSFTEGPILRRMIPFVLRVAATSILQQLFTSADMAIVGKFVSDSALAAVGCTGPLIGLFIEFFIGLSNSSNVIISRHLGAGEDDHAKRAMHTSLILALMAGILVCIVGFCSAGALLQAMSVPADLLADSTLYLRIYFLCMPFFMVYNFTAAIFRSFGDTTRPLICLSVSGAINVGLNIFFILAFDMGIAGVALATVISNAIACISLLILLTRKSRPIRLIPKEISFDKDIFTRILKIGIPSGFLGSVFSISNVCMQSGINSLSTQAISASTAASNIEIYIQFVGNAFANSTTTFIGHNYGAKEYQRCSKVLKTAILACVTVTAVLSAGVMLFSRPLLKIFVTEQAVITIALSRMKYTVVFKFVQAVMDILIGCMQGYGFTLVPALISIFGVCGTRLVWLYAVFPHYRTLAAIMFIYPVTQAIACLLLWISYLYVRKHRCKEV